MRTGAATTIRMEMVADRALTAWWLLPFSFTAYVVANALGADHVRVKLPVSEAAFLRRQRWDRLTLTLT